MKVETVLIGQVTPYVRNPRKNEAAVAKVAASIKEFGWRQPIVVDEKGVIIAGHTRLLAAQRLGLAEVPVHVAIGLSEAQVKAYRLMDNRSGQEAEWDENLLSLEFADLKEMKFDLELTGFEQDEIASMFGGGTEGLTDPDEAPDAPEEPVTRPGDLIVLGNHRLLCGDATVATDVERLMGEKRAGLMNTDPPYGIAYVSNAQSKGQGTGYGDIENDELDGEKLQSFLEEAIRSAVPFLTENAAFYLWHPMLTQGMFFAAAAAAAAADVLISRQIIWVKPSLVFGRGDYHWRHELCFYGWRRGHKPPFYGERNQTTIWEVGRENDKVHPTQKPVELFARPIMNHTITGGVIYEPFAGSGSQIIAAERSGRLCCAMEIDPKYCDVIVQRWENFTGKKAQRPERVAV